MLAKMGSLVIGIAILMSYTLISCASTGTEAQNASEGSPAGIAFNSQSARAKARAVLQTPAPGVTAVAVSRDGRFVASGGDSGLVVIRQLSDNLVVSRMKTPVLLHGLSFSSDGRRLAVLNNKLITVRDTFTGEIMTELNDNLRNGTMSFGPGDRSLWVVRNPDAHNGQLTRYGLHGYSQILPTNTYIYPCQICSIDVDEASEQVAISAANGDFTVFLDGPSGLRQLYKRDFGKNPVVGVGFVPGGKEWILLLQDRSIVRVGRTEARTLSLGSVSGTPRRAIFFDGNRQVAVVLQTMKTMCRLVILNLETGQNKSSTGIFRDSESDQNPLVIAANPDFSHFFTTISNKEDSNFLNDGSISRESHTASANFYSVDDHFGGKCLRLQYTGDSTNIIMSCGVDLGALRSDKVPEIYNRMFFDTLLYPGAFSTWNWTKINAINSISGDGQYLLSDDPDFIVMNRDGGLGYHSDYLIRREGESYSCSKLYDMPSAGFSHPELISRDGRYFLIQADFGKADSKIPSLVVMDLKTGKVLWDLKNADVVQSFISPNGKYVVVYYNSSEPQVFECRTGKSLFPFHPTKLGMGSWASNPAFDSTDSSMAVASDTEFGIFSFPSLQLKKRIPANINAVTTPGRICFSDDGKFLFWRENDNVIIARIETGMVVNFTRSGNEWLFYTDDGYFEGSSGAGRLLAIVDKDRAYGIDQFAARYNRPDIILQRLGLAGENPELQDFFKERYRKRLARMGIREEDLEAPLALPETSIESFKAEGSNALLKARFTDKSASLSRYSIYINDVPLFGAEGLPLEGSEQTVEVPLVLCAGENKIEVSCFNARGTESLRVLTRAKGPAMESRPDLWYLGFGVSVYANEDLKLGYAHKDALDLKEAFSRMEGQNYSAVHARTYTDAMVSKGAITDAKTFLAEAKEADTVVLFIAGHGIYTQGSADPDYYFVVYDTDVARLEETAIRFAAIEELLQGIPSRQKLFLMDTCNSGEVDEAVSGSRPATLAETTRARAIRGLTIMGVKAGGAAPKRTWLQEKERYILNDLIRRSGAVVLSSSKGGEYSYETETARNGLFTRAILDALAAESGADTDMDGAINVRELAAYVEKRVPETSEGLQHPGIDRDNLMVNFSLPIPDKE